MLENGCEILNTREQIEFNNIQQISGYIENLYPQIHLPEPLNLLDLENTNRKYRMGSNEKQFAFLLLNKKMIVYREPTLENCERIPDFFVFNPKVYEGKLVEITLFPSSTRNSRKVNQINELLGCGIPFVSIFREQQENIRRFCWEGLF